MSKHAKNQCEMIVNPDKGPQFARNVSIFSHKIRQFPNLFNQQEPS